MPAHAYIRIGCACALQSGLQLECNAANRRRPVGRQANACIAANHHIAKPLPATILVASSPQTSLLSPGCFLTSEPHSSPEKESRRSSMGGEAAGGRSETNPEGGQTRWSGGLGRLDGFVITNVTCSILHVSWCKGSQAKCETEVSGGQRRSFGSGSPGTPWKEHGI